MNIKLCLVSKPLERHDTQPWPKELNNSLEHYGFCSFTAQPNYEIIYMTSPNYWTSGFHSKKLGPEIFEEKSSLAN